jgi:hypothetical protein
MPRPRNGYTNAAGQPIPGTNDITGRYKDSGALIHWAHKQGAAGLPLYDRSAIDIGSAVHKMAELDLIGARIGRLRPRSTTISPPRTISRWPTPRSRPSASGGSSAA